MSDPTELTLRQAASAIAEGTISASDLLAATMRRLERMEPHLHAFAAVFTERAEHEARKADDEIRAGHWRGPLHGIPVAVKDVCYAEGAPTEAGSHALAGFMAPFEATVVRRLRDAGAILIGKTVTHEFAYGRNTPPTRNARNQAYYPGGSSAGSGVAVAASLCFGAIGTDTGGSIRVPASVNGIVGLKPTYGRVSRHGVIPLSSSLDTVGPLTRTVEDCALVLQAIAGFDANDATSIRDVVPDYTVQLDAGIEGLTLGVDRRYFLDEGVDPEVREAFDRALGVFHQLGAHVIDIDLPELRHMMPVGLTIMLSEASAWHRRLWRRRAELYEPSTRVMVELGEFLFATHYVTAQKVRTVLRDAEKRAFRAHELDALVAPTLPTPAFRLDTSPSGDTEPGMNEALTGYGHHCFPANVTGQPALSLPCGVSQSRLPIGLQVVGRPFDEATVLRIGRAYERQRGSVEG